jgi:hypothetical protein
LKDIGTDLGALVLEDAGDYEDVRDALRREERLAEACYEI